jgi:hypothetical protein
MHGRLADPLTWSLLVALVMVLIAVVRERGGLG